MALCTYVYISGVNNLSDARYCAGMGVDTLGFSLNPKDQNFVDSEKFKEITSWVAGVKLAGEFDQLDAKQIKAIVSDYNLDFIVTANPNVITEITNLDIPIVLHVDGTFSIEEVKNLAQGFEDQIAFYINSNPLIANEAENALSIETDSVLIGHDIAPDNVLELIKAKNRKGIALQGGDEIKPGYKDFDGLADILEVLEVDEGY